MLRATRLAAFYMKLGDMFVDYKLASRDHKRALRVEGALVDPTLPVTVAPLSWLEQLRSPSSRLPKGFYVEEAVYLPPKYAQAGKGSGNEEPNAIRAGPVVMYITGQATPVVLNVHFVPDEMWGLLNAPSASDAPTISYNPEGQASDGKEWDLRIGMDAISQCTLFSELRPGGLLHSKLPSSANVRPTEPARETLKRYGMKCGLSESPLVPRPWTRMRYMFIDELQRGPKMTEFVGYNPRNGTQWRFSQHTKYFRVGIWRETIRRNEMNEGIHAHSSWQKSPQQAVPEVRFLAP